MSRRYRLAILIGGSMALLAALAASCTSPGKPAVLSGANLSSPADRPTASPGQLAGTLQPETGMGVSISSVSVDYSSGQTFITWTERADLTGEVYRVYRSAAPITAQNLTSARLLGEVGKNSAVFYTNRYHDTESGTWKTRYLDRLAIHNNQPPLPEGTGLLVWTLSPQDFSGAQEGQGYYAVTVVVPGQAAHQGAPAVVGPVREAVDDPRPVEITLVQHAHIGPGGHIYIQYMDLHNWNPTFHAPNQANAFYGLSPTEPGLDHSLQYAYDYAVFVPTPDLCGGSLPDKLPVLLHLHGWNPNNLTALSDYPDKYCAYGIYPVDTSNTWYFGFARQADYRTAAQPAAGDVIVNYTEQRVLRMIYDLEQDPPGPEVDVQRIYVSGESMGGTGSLAFAERYPNVFAAAYASQPMTNFRTAGVTIQDWGADVSVKWGSSGLNLPVAIDAPAGWAGPIQKYAGVGVWDWQNLLASASGGIAGRLADDMALLGIIHGYRDHVLPWASQGEAVPGAFDLGRRAWGGMVTDDDHYWMYYLGLPPSFGARGADKIAHFPFWRFKVIRDETVPGLSYTSGDTAYSSAGPAQYNQTVMWSSSWNRWDGIPSDQQELWQVSLCAVAAGSQTCGTGLPQTVDVTPRRVQHFVITPGTTYSWENRQVSDDALVESGIVQADADGLLTVTGFKVSPAGNRLLIRLKGAGG
ncbi:MAG TPA: hypothetical protein VF813_01645 [Anaerolineaceae bacterium]